ncbi:MAG: transcriptional regulator GcvA [Rhodospirillales bacterium]|nr:transcriptional regulator GcvA [Rhodospirillales bacterium]
MDVRLSTLPLNGLRAFDAAARHLSFTAAAEELAVTPAAISHQIRGLEDRLGVRLFERRTRAVHLTEAGRTLLPETTQAFQTLQRALSRLDRLGDDETLTVTTSPSLGSRWLMPRLGSFEERHPEIEVRVSVSNQLVDLSAGHVDAALRFGRGLYPGMQIDQLSRVQLFPVCSPKLNEGEHPLREPADLRHHNLLHDDSWVYGSGIRPGWDMWLKTLGVDGIGASRGDRFDGAPLVVQAAVLGRGVALVSADMASDELDDGHLIRPFCGDDSINLEFGIYFVSPPEALGKPPVAAFRAWVLETFQAEEFRST